RADVRSALRALPPQHPTGHRIELLEQLLVARFRGGDQRIVERAIGTVRARLVLAPEVGREPPHQRLGLVGMAVSTEMMSCTVTASWSGCQQSKSVTMATVA